MSPQQHLIFDRLAPTVGPRQQGGGSGLGAESAMERMQEIREWNDRITAKREQNGLDEQLDAASPAHSASAAAVATR